MVASVVPITIFCSAQAHNGMFNPTNVSPIVSCMYEGNEL